MSAGTFSGIPIYMAVYFKKGITTTLFRVFVHLFRNNTLWSVVVTAEGC